MTCIQDQGVGNNNPRVIVAANNDCKFFLNIKNYDSNLTMFWISVCGTQIDAESYEFELKILNSTEKRAKEMYLFTAKRGCMSCDVSYEDMKQKGSALFLNKYMLESAANQIDGKFLKIDCTLLIKKK